MLQRKRKSSAPKRRRLKAKPTISIIGAGRLGTTLARALHQHGYRVEAVVAARAAHARRSAKLIGVGVKALGLSGLRELPPSDLLLITTPDDVIGLVAQTLSQIPGPLAGGGKGTTKGKLRASRSRRVVLHASGAMSAAVLQPLKNVGFSVGSMHPLVSINQPATDPKIFRGAFFCLEGDRSAVGLAGRIAGDLGAQKFSLRADDKPLYHAAAVMSSGHVVSLFDIATEMLVECGLTKQRARAVLLPLLTSTLTSLISHAPAQALTGPFARGDGATAHRHLAAINDRHLRDALAAYKLLGHRALKLAAQSGLSQKVLRAMKREIDSA
jgi:predicted short-subunit dehydrogenase-like oxidoreductase (DUF2520 family)